MIEIKLRVLTLIFLFSISLTSATVSTDSDGTVTQEFTLDEGWNTVNIRATDVSFEDDIKDQCSFSWFYERNENDYTIEEVQEDPSLIDEDERYYVWERWGGGWDHPDELSPDRGYMLSVAEESCEITIEGEAPSYESVETEDGWNIVNLPEDYDPTELYEVCSTDGDSDLRWYWRQDELEDIADELDVDVGEVDPGFIGENQDEIPEEYKHFFWLRSGDEWSHPESSEDIESHQSVMINTDGACELDIYEREEEQEPETTEDAFFELERTDTPGTYNIVSNQEGLNILGNSIPLEFSSPGQTESFNYETDSGETERALTSPSFSMSFETGMEEIPVGGSYPLTGREHAFVSTGTEIEAEILNYDDNPFEEYGQDVADKTFYYSGSSDDLETESTDSEPPGHRGYESATVSPSSPGTFTLTASVTDTAPGVGITANESRQFWVADEYLSDFMLPNYGTSYYDSDAIDESWSVYYDGEQTDSWAEDQTIGLGYQTGVESLIVDRKRDGEVVAETLVLNRSIGVEGDFEMIFRAYSNSNNNKLVFWKEDGTKQTYAINTDNSETTSEEEAFYKLEYVDGQLTLRRDDNNNGGIFHDTYEVSSDSIDSISGFGFEVSGDQRLTVDYLGLQSVS